MRSLVCIAEGMAMKATKVKKRRKRRVAVAAPAEKVSATPALIFSSDLLTPEEERELLTGFWECKLELVKTLLRTFNRLRAHRPAMEPWPMAQFIRDYCDD